MSRYRSGRRLEYAVAAILRESGWLVLRSAGSHGPYDLVAIRSGRVVGIQIKAAASRRWCEQEEKRLRELYGIESLVLNRERIRELRKRPAAAVPAGTSDAGRGRP